MKSWSWVLLIVMTILIKWASWYPGWVERNYTYGIYPVISKTQRFLFGWIPFSFGDLFYSFLILVIIVKTGYFLKLLFKKKLNRQYFVSGLQQIIFFFLFVYVFFNLLWGLNYNRLGISSQLEIEVKPYTIQDLDTLAGTMQKRLNHYAELVTSPQRDSFNRKRTLFSESEEAYKNAANTYSFLAYRPRSAKPSIFSYLGNYLGFQGYYNPFSGEAQVNTTIPRFLEPFVTMHEIAHQLGYAKENEANFVGYIASKEYPSPAFQYSLYFDMYQYTINEVARRDTAMAMRFQKNLHPQVIRDMKELRAFYARYQNPIEPIIMWGYSNYLKANNQPSGKMSYNEVVASLIAYYKKYGIQLL